MTFSRENKADSPSKQAKHIRFALPHKIFATFLVAFCASLFFIVQHPAQASAVSIVSDGGIKVSPNQKAINVTADSFVVDFCNNLDCSATASVTFPREGTSYIARNVDIGTGGPISCNYDLAVYYNSGSNSANILPIFNGGSLCPTASQVSVAATPANQTIHPSQTYTVCVIGFTDANRRDCLLGAEHASQTDFCSTVSASEILTVEGCKKGQAAALADAENAKVVGAAAAATTQAECDEIKGKWDGKTCAAPDTAATQQDTSTDCPLGQDTGMRWLACSMFWATSGILDTLNSMISDLMYTPINDIFNADFKKVADKFRLFGMAIIVIAGLVMIIAQATGSDLVDAYTVRKVMPRLVFALVGVGLCWPILKFFVGFINDMGLLIGNFIGNLGSASWDSSKFDIGNAIGGSTMVTMGAIAVAYHVVTAMNAGAILSLMATGVMALLIAVSVLAIRQLVIVVLILLAPLAIGASVLPGTDKLWKFWKNTLITTLALFPVIMLFIKSGEFLARVAGNMPGDNMALLAILAMYAPYFLIPFAFKMVGGLMGNIFQIANDKSKGAFDRLKNYRANVAKRRKEDMIAGRLDAGPKLKRQMRDENGNLMYEKNADGTDNKSKPMMETYSPLSNFAVRAAQSYEGGFALTKAGRQRYNAFRQKQLTDETKKSQQADANYGTGDTKATKIAMHATSRDEFIEKYADAYTASDYGGDREKARLAARATMARLEGSLQTKMGTKQMQMASARGRVAADNTAYFDEKENKTEYSELFGDVAQQVQRGNLSFMDGVSLIRENKNRADMSGFSTGQTIELLQAAIDNGTKEGGTYGLKEDEVTRAEQYAYGSANASSTLHGNPRVAKAMSGVTEANLAKARDGKLIPLSNKTREQTQAAIGERAQQILTRTNAAAAREGSTTQPIDIAEAQKRAEREYREASLIGEYAKLSNIQDSLGQALPDVQDVYEQVLGQKIDLATFAGNDDFRNLLGITQAQIDNHEEMTNADILERLRPHMNERRYVWSAGQEEAEAHARPPAQAEPGAHIEPPRPGV